MSAPWWQRSKGKYSYSILPLQWSQMTQYSSIKNTDQGQSNNANWYQPVPCPCFYRQNQRLKCNNYALSTIVKYSNGRRRADKSLRYGNSRLPAVILIVCKLMASGCRVDIMKRTGLWDLDPGILYQGLSLERWSKLATRRRAYKFFVFSRKTGLTNCQSSTAMNYQSFHGTQSRLRGRSSIEEGGYVKRWIFPYNADDSTNGNKKWCSWRDCATHSN